MIKLNNSSRESLWNTVDELIQNNNTLNRIMEINVPNKSANMRYVYANVKFNNYEFGYQSAPIEIILNVSCEPGVRKSIPEVWLMFNDGNNVERRDEVSELLRHNLPNYIYKNEHKNEEGISKIRIRRRKQHGQVFGVLEEATALVEILEAVVSQLQ